MRINLAVIAAVKSLMINMGEIQTLMSATKKKKSHTAAVTDCLPSSKQSKTQNPNELKQFLQLGYERRETTQSGNKIKINNNQSDPSSWPLKLGKKKANKWRVSPINFGPAVCINTCYSCPVGWAASCWSGGSQSVLVLKWSRWTHRKKSGNMVFTALLCLLFLRPGVAALMSSPLEEVGGKAAGWTGALRLLIPSAKYIELFNFKLFIILRFF